MKCLKCGDCCTRFYIEKFDKPAGERCPHLTDKNLCDIWGTLEMPIECFKHDYPGDICPIGLSKGGIC